MEKRDYSHRDVLDKLGIRPGQKVRLVGKGDAELIQRIRSESKCTILSREGGMADLVLYWPRTEQEIPQKLGNLRQQIEQDGVIWVITAKRGCKSSSGMNYFNQTDLIPYGLMAKLVDNKTCSVSDAESGMRFVIRKKDRK